MKADAGQSAGADLELRDVWRRDDAGAEEDAVALWNSDRALVADADPVARSKMLCIAAYEAGELVGVSTIKIQRVSPVRTDMGYLRIYVAKAHRSRGLIHPIAAATYDAMSRFALANSGLRLGGLAATVRATPGIYKPISETGFVLIGYELGGAPLIVRWFDHYRL